MLRQLTTRLPRSVVSTQRPAVAQMSAQYRSISNLAYDCHQPQKAKFDETTSPIIFLHGLFGSKKNNRTMSRVLARDLGRYVYALDLRNHGQSPHDPRHDYDAMAEDVSEFIREHGFRDTTIIGHSMGAKTAMTIALGSPELVSNIVSVDNAPIDAILSTDFGSYVRGMKKIEASQVSRQSDADKILREVEPSLPIRQFLLGNLHRPQGSSKMEFQVPLDILGKSLNKLGDFPFKNPDEVRFNKPALFVRGTKSKYVPDEVLPAIGEFFPRFRLADVDAGHWLISEQPEAFRQAVVDFLQDTE